MNTYKKAVVELLKKATGLKEIELTQPPKPDMGDYAFPCFTLTKKLKKSPNEIAQDLCKNIKLEDPIKEVKVIGPFLNFYINKNILAKDILTQIAKEKEKFGQGKKKKDRVMIEYHQPNTHKGFHVGHL
ncbi:arginine--tRNA ligase, partial [Nanoarchaeota archaeon]